MQADLVVPDEIFYTAQQEQGMLILPATTSLLLVPCTMALTVA